MKSIGLLYVNGSLPAFENFGKLPTHLLKENGMIKGQKAYEVLDGLILPGGSIIESQSISREVETVIKKMDSQGKFILGMCSGFQVLAKKTDIGRKSPCPVERDGLGILDVTFHPLIGTDRVESEVVDESFLTKGMVGQTITGFHCHTYGDIRGNAPPIFFSKVQRINYTDNPRMILSGVRNDEGNVIGTMVHASLDENPSLGDNILKFIDANQKDILKIYEDNKALVKKMKREVGIGLDIYSHYRLSTDKPTPTWLMIAGTGSDSGKTFITTGIVGALRKKGYKVGVLKVGPDIRDLVPSLYLNKDKMGKYSSIQIGGLGWKSLEEIIANVNGHKYDLILVEGVMSIFTGILNKKTPFSAAEIAKAGKIPVLLVTGCNKGGIETAAIDLASHTDMMQKIGIKVQGAILNKVYDEKIAETALTYLKNTTQLEWLGKVPKVQLAARCGTPEVEIKLEDFCYKATETVEKHLDLNKIIKMGETPKFTGYSSYKEIKNDFIDN